MNSYRKAVLAELHLREFSFSPFPTVYFGGGTPSLMEPSFFESILSKVGQFSEVTVEFNPEDVSLEKLKILSDMGVNRISLGIQSMSSNLLRVLGRTHSVELNYKALEFSCSTFANVSVDLIYGIPGQNVKSFLKDLAIILSFPVKHISLYALTVYKGTPLFQEVSSGKIKLPEDEEVFNLYAEACVFLEDCGFRQYEISNFSIPEFESKHNLNYWKMENYLGVGPSAASFQEPRYWKNVSSISSYLGKLEKGKFPVSEEYVYSPKELLEIKLMMGLRLVSGVNLKALNLDRPFEEKLTRSGILNELLERGLIGYEEGNLRLGREGFFISNAVISQLLKELF